MNKSKDANTIVCPACTRTTDITRIHSIPIDDSPIMLHEDVGEIYQCGHADCISYILKVNNKFESISKFDLLKRQKEITDMLIAESEVARARVYPKGAEIAAKVEMADVLSTVLYHLTAESPHHRAYLVDEVIEACETLGFNPSKVDNKRIGFVLGWLKENKP